MTPRRRPHCHTCGNPMAGHRRLNGIVVCPDGGARDQEYEMEGEDDDEYPDEAPPSPPQTPGHRPRGLMRQPFTDFSLPEDRSWHRKNPNWIEPPPPRRPRPLQAEPEIPQIILPSSSEAHQRDGSYVSTVRDSVSPVGVDKNESDEGVQLPAEAAPATPDSLVFASKMPLASVFSVTARDVNTAQRTARKLGLHTGLIPKPPESDTSSRARKLSAQRSWWMVVGKSDTAVQHLLDAHQKELPGRLDEEPRMEYASRERRGLSFLQLVLAGVIGGLIVVYGLGTFL